MARVELGDFLYDRRPDFVHSPRVLRVDQQLAENLGGVVSYESRSGLTATYDVHLPFGLEVWPHYRTDVHHVEGLYRPEHPVRSYIAIPDKDDLPVVHVRRQDSGVLVQLARLPHPFRWAPPLERLFAECKPETVRLRALGEMREFPIETDGNLRPQELPRNLQVAIAQLTAEWREEWNGAASPATTRWGLELCADGSVYRCRQGIRTHLVRAPISDPAAYGSEGSWETHLPDGCSDITESVPGVPPAAGVHVLVSPDGDGNDGQVVAVRWIGGEWWDYHVAFDGDDPMNAARQAVDGLGDKIAQQTARPRKAAW